jgi:hypothetical protein
VFPQALTQAVERLDKARQKGLIQSYALVGGFAVSAWGVARATQDIDLAVALGTTEPKALAAHLNAMYQPGDADDPLRGVFRLGLKCEGQDVPVQLIVLQPKWADVAFRGIETLNLYGCVVPVVNWQALVLLKVYAAGPVDLHDAKSIVAVRQPSPADRENLIVQADALGVGQEVRTLFNLPP